jgi:hypothetical protein
MTAVVCSIWYGVMAYVLLWVGVSATLNDRGPAEPHLQRRHVLSGIYASGYSPRLCFDYISTPLNVNAQQRPLGDRVACGVELGLVWCIVMVI